MGKHLQACIIQQLPKDVVLSHMGRISCSGSDSQRKIRNTAWLSVSGREGKLLNSNRRGGAYVGCTLAAKINRWEALKP